MGNFQQDRDKFNLAALKQYPKKGLDFLKPNKRGVWNWGGSFHTTIKLKVGK